jgi:hypothetical protein
LLQHREHVGQKLEQERSEADYRSCEKLRHSVPELGGAEPVLLLFNHLSGASTVSVLLNHASLDEM